MVGRQGTGVSKMGGAPDGGSNQEDSGALGDQSPGAFGKTLEDRKWQAHELECASAALASLVERKLMTKADMRKYLAEIGSKGGKTKGKAKRRSKAHYERLAAMKRKGSASAKEVK
jgi:hypothetical protein